MVEWWRQLALARTPCGLTDANFSEPIIVGELFNIQFYTQDGRYLTFFHQHFRDLYKQRQVYCAPSLASLNEGSISLHTFQLLYFLLFHFAFLYVAHLVFQVCVWLLTIRHINTTELEQCVPSTSLRSPCSVTLP